MTWANGAVCITVQVAKDWIPVPATILLLGIPLPPEARHPLVPFVPLHLFALLGSRPRRQENRVIDQLLVRDVVE
jgi:hypothetical protein